MKKNGRKDRKLQKEKLEQKKNQKNIPFSKASKKVHICKHYGICSGSHLKMNGSYSDILLAPSEKMANLMKRMTLQSPIKICLKCGKAVHENGDHYISKLVLSGENECKCKECGAVFPAELFNRMEQLVDVLSNEVVESNSERWKTLTEGMEIVYYRRVSEQEKEICGRAGMAGKI